MGKIFLYSIKDTKTLMNRIQQGMKRQRNRLAAAAGAIALILLSGCGSAEVSEKETEIELVEAEDLPAQDESQDMAASEKTDEDGRDAAGSDEMAAEQNGQPGNAGEEEGEAEQEGDADRARLQKYQAVLTDVLEKQVYPDGSDCGYDGYYPLSDNCFAVSDVDRDGKEELILVFSTSTMAGMREIVYDYDENTDCVTEEYSGFPGAVYYESGLLAEGMSHNHGMAPMGDFWPYMVYRYQPETDTYECIFTVDGWEKEYRSEDYDGNPYPEDVDTGKDGIVFLIMEGGDYDSSLATILGKGDYEKWREEQGLNGAAIKVTFQELTVENIGTLF